MGKVVAVLAAFGALAVAGSRPRKDRLALTIRYAVITAATAAVVIGGGVAFGSTHSTHQSTPEPSPLSAPQVRQSVREKCEQDREQIRKEHPDAVISECNYGEGTLTIP